MDPDCNVNLVKENCPDYCNNCDIFESRRIIDQNGMYFDIIVPILNKMKYVGYLITLFNQIEILISFRKGMYGVPLHVM